MEFENIKDIHEIDQALAESVDLGNVRIDGTDKQGQNLYSLTTKGVIRTALMIINLIIEQADQKKRDFTAEEKQQIKSHVATITKALKA